jgi:hypothetical protein
MVGLMKAAHNCVRDDRLARDRCTVCFPTSKYIYLGRMKYTQLDMAYEHVNDLSFLRSFGDGISYTLLTMENLSSCHVFTPEDHTMRRPN